MENVKIYRVPTKKIDNVWAHAKDFIKRAHDRAPPTHTLDDVYQELKNGQSFLLIAADDKRVWGAAIIMFNAYPQMLTCRVTYLGGDSAKLWIKEMIDDIDNMAKEVGCKAIESIGRKGWARLWGAVTYGNVLYRGL